MFVHKLSGCIYCTCTCILTVHILGLYNVILCGVVQCTGAGGGETESYQRIHVDDGSATVDTLDYLVSQTAHLHAHLGAGLHNPLQGCH